MFTRYFSIKPDSKSFFSKRRGVSLIEILVVSAILGLITPVLLSFVWNSVGINRRVEGAIINQRNARQVMDLVKKELRKARSGAGNQYPLQLCEPNQIIYFSDIDDDGQIDRVRYYLEEGTFKRGVIKPVGENYPIENEQLLTVMPHIQNDETQPIFSYYNSQFTGTGNSLVEPISCGEVRLLEIRFRIDTVLELAPGAFELRSMVHFRNMKNNL